MHVSRFAKAAGSCAGNIIILIEIINRDYNYRSRSSREILNGKQDYAVSMITINGITMKVANKKLTTATKESSKEEEISLAIDIVYLLYFFSLFFFFCHIVLSSFGVDFTPRNSQWTRQLSLAIQTRQTS